MNKKYIFILGTGRCGTMSLVHLLNKNENFNITHERNRLPWKFNPILLGIALERLSNREQQIVGDAGFWYLQYAKAIIQSNILRKTYFICLKRDRDETIKSYMEKTPTSNNWTEVGSKYFDKAHVVSESWYNCYPHYNLPKEEALYKFYDEYYETARLLAKRFDNFSIFSMNDVLNNANVQTDLYRFIDAEERSIFLGIKENAGRHKDGINIA